MSGSFAQAYVVLKEREAAFAPEPSMQIAGIV